jgi:hypothetical protein
MRAFIPNQFEGRMKVALVRVRGRIVKVGADVASTGLVVGGSGGGFSLAEDLRRV